MHQESSPTHTRRLLLVPLLAATVLAVALTALLPSIALGSSHDRVNGVTVAAGSDAGELHITWDAPSSAPNDYRVNWALNGESFPSWRNPEGNAFPTEPGHTVTGLEAGGEYKVRVRARYGSDGAGPWSAVAYGTAAAAALVPQIAQQQVVATLPATMDECGEQIKAGNVQSCAADSFSVKATRADGRFSINWSVWASQHDNISHYIVQHLEFQYRNRFKLASTNEPFNVEPAEGNPYGGYTEPNSCEAAVRETDSNGRAISFWWRCASLTNVYVDTEGNPTSVVTDASVPRSQPYWEDSLASPSRKHDVPVTVMRIPARAPTSLDDELTQAELDDTFDLTATETQMLLYGITVHFDDETTEFHYALVTG